VVIFGAVTKKIIDIQINNQECSVCMANEKRETEVQHVCYKDTLVGAVETKLAVKAFQNAENYQLRYTQLVSDADVKLYPAIKKSVTYGVEKIDCSVHTLRALKRHLYKVN
jgi:hypothetical protein